MGCTLVGEKLSSNDTVRSDAAVLLIDDAREAAWLRLLGNVGPSAAIPTTALTACEGSSDARSLRRPHH